MKTVLVFVALMAGMAAVAQAVDFGVFGSYWSPKDGDDAFGGGGSIHFATVPLELRASVFPDTSIRGGGDTLLVPIDFGLAVNLTRSEKMGLYVGAGGSYYFIDADRGDPDNQFGWYALGRLEVPIQGSMAVFGDVMYRGVEFEDIDADLSGVAFSVGVIFR
jgi:hypothetical protein